MGVKYSAVRVTGASGESMTWTYPSLAEAQAAKHRFVCTAGVMSAEILDGESTPRLVDPDALVAIVRLAADYLQDFAAAIERMPQPASTTAYDRGSPAKFMDDEDAGSYVHYEAEREELARKFREASGNRVIKLSEAEPSVIRDSDGDLWTSRGDGYSLFNAYGDLICGPYSREYVAEHWGPLQ